ncbi:MAG: hypothetical protein EXS12_02320 [Phycisphaerales bacterium]|nr:hypothetical protein [Phycisphaerales bacterium]
MENRNASPAIDKPGILKDNFEAVRRPSADEVPDLVEMAALRQACQRTRLSRSVIAEPLIKKFR